jgi:hypothetical protein
LVALVKYFDGVFDGNLSDEIDRQENSKRLVKANSLPAEVEMAAGWDTCIASIGRPATQANFKLLFERGFHKPGDVETHLSQALADLNV